MQPCHVKSKTPLEILWGFQLEKTSTEKSVSEEHPAHALYIAVNEGSDTSKLVSEEQLSHANNALVANGSCELKLTSDTASSNAERKLVAVGNGVLNEVRPLDCHALLKFTLLASVPSFASCGNEVRAEQFCHADVKFEQFLMSVVLNSESAVLLYHA